MVKINFDKITESWQKNLVDEYQVLDERIVKLTTALDNYGFEEKVGGKEYKLLTSQLNVMNEYETILEERLIDLGLATKE